MGGPGSGRHSLMVTAITSEYLQLDIRRLQRDGLLVDGNCFTWQWKLDGDEVDSIRVRIGSDRVILPARGYSDETSGRPKKYSVFLVWTPCHYGGMRPWFPARC